MKNFLNHKHHNGTPKDPNRRDFLKTLGTFSTAAIGVLTGCGSVGEYKEKENFYLDKGETYIYNTILEPGIYEIEIFPFEFGDPAMEILIGKDFFEQEDYYVDNNYSGEREKFRIKITRPTEIKLGIRNLGVNDYFSLSIIKEKNY